MGFGWAARTLIGLATAVASVAVAEPAECSADGAAGSSAAGVPSGDLVVELTGMKSDDGSAVYAVWSGPERWLEDGAIREGAVPIEGGTGTITLTDLPYGEYAVSVFHDRNGNGKLDTGLFRIPKEPIGTSNDARARFGPPKYEDAAFVLDQPDLTISIGIRNVF